MITYIRKNERGLLFKNGDYIKYLEPGKHSYFSFLNYEIHKLDIQKPLSLVYYPLDILLKDEELKNDLFVFDVADNEYVLHFIDNRFENIYTSGKYAFFNINKEHSIIRIDKNNPVISPNTLDFSILNNPKLVNYFNVFVVEDYQVGLLYYNKKYIEKLQPGIYYYWKTPTNIEIKTFDLRQQQLELSGQEIMTEDKIVLRLNFICQYKITDPIKANEIKSFESQVYIRLQLVLREYIGTVKLDELLKNKDKISNYVLNALKELQNSLGIEFIYAGLKDIILPGEIKDILNTVLIAEKQAQANVIMRREETASTRSLLNTAKLMDENKTLYKLKELEYLERICDKVGNISVVGGGNLIEHLKEIVSK
ncbi:MAG: slipin family protein [Eubacteriales bacterium]